MTQHHEFEEEEFTTQFNGHTMRRILALTTAPLGAAGGVPDLHRSDGTA